MLTMSDQLQADNVLQSMPLLLYWALQVIVAKDKTPKRGCRWPDVENPHVPVEGVEEFVCLGSKQSSNGYYAGRMFYAGLDFPVQRWIFYRGYGIAVISVSAPNTPVPSTDKVCSALTYIDSLGSRYEYTGCFPDEMSATDTWCMLVGSWHPMQKCFSDLVCQPMVTS